MTCKLCLELKPLCGSHIISECFYEQIYDEKHRFLPISTDDEKLKFQQMGFREELLCCDCENRLSKWESTLKRDFVDIGNEKSNFLTISRVHSAILKVKNIKYDYFKRGILSILWRLAVSSNPFFRKYRLGPYEDKIRQLLKHDEEIPESKYAVMISKCKLDDQYFPGIMMGFPPGKISKSITVHKFIVWGFFVNILITDHAPIDSFECINLKLNGEVYVTETQYTEFANPNSVIARLFEKDVVDMINKMTK